MDSDFKNIFAQSDEFVMSVPTRHRNVSAQLLYQLLITHAESLPEECVDNLRRSALILDPAVEFIPASSENSMGEDQIVKLSYDYFSFRTVPIPQGSGDFPSKPEDCELSHHMPRVEVIFPIATFSKGIITELRTLKSGVVYEETGSSLEIDPFGPIASSFILSENKATLAMMLHRVNPDMWNPVGQIATFIVNEKEYRVRLITDHILRKDREVEQFHWKCHIIKKKQYIKSLQEDIQQDGHEIENLDKAIEDLAGLRPKNDQIARALRLKHHQRDRLLKCIASNKAMIETETKNIADYIAYLKGLEKRPEGLIVQLPKQDLPPEDIQPLADKSEWISWNPEHYAWKITWLEQRIKDAEEHFYDENNISIIIMQWEDRLKKLKRNQGRIEELIKKYGEATVKEALDNTPLQKGPRA